MFITGFSRLKQILIDAGLPSILRIWLALIDQTDQRLQSFCILG
jgi:hypothetical protein